MGRLDLTVGCDSSVAANVLCEKSLPSSIAPQPVPVNGTGIWPRDTAFVTCPLRHYTHQFLACDLRTLCWLGERSSAPSPSLTSSSWPCATPGTTSTLLAHFSCANQMEHVPYTLVCDLRADCTDGSDEDFCRVPPCRREQSACNNKQCIPTAKMCDGWWDCHGGEDEHQCSQSFQSLVNVPPPALVVLSRAGRLVVKRLTSDAAGTPPQPLTCPRTHFQCRDDGYCLPVFLRCNGVYDCPGREDEEGCDACPGFFRCRASTICLSHGEICDGRVHCPQHDDELSCESTCPPSCECRGLAFFCKRGFAAWDYTSLRFLDASRSGIPLERLTGSLMLVHLVLADCGIARLDGLSLPNLLILDIRDNRLSALSHVHLDGLPQLRDLSAAGNPLRFVFDVGQRPLYSQRIRKLDLSRVLLRVLNVTALSAFPKLHLLNLSHCGVQRIHGSGFGIMKQLRVIDLRGCPMTWFPRQMFQGLRHLQAVHAHSFKVCCSDLLPLDFNLRNCFAPPDEISSCDDLLRGNVYSVSVFAVALLALVGNAVSFIFRTYFSKRESKLGYGNFVTHLSVSDFLTGIYLSIVGVADQVYHGTYLWNEAAWKRSFACKLAGVISMLSSEVSALILCFITIDRFLVLRFPFSQLHFSPRSAHVASVAVWIVGMLLASVPLLPVTSHWEFYRQNGICIPLPITTEHFAGHLYSFSILIVFNFALFVFISMGQLSIYWSVRVNSMSVSNTTKKTKDLTLASRLISVVMTDFLCWFPIGVLGLLASNGVPIPGEVVVAVTIFVLPLNSAVNPCLYTLNVILERRNRVREGKLLALLLAQIKARS